MSCALTTGETFFNRHGRRTYVKEPVVDSGLKTIEVVARDAEGNTGTASAEVYVFVEWTNLDQVLRGGETYRVESRLFTFPEGMEGFAGAYAEVNCEGTPCENVFYFKLVGEDFAAWMGFGANSGRELERSIRLDDRTRTEREAEIRRKEIDRLLDSLSNSVDVLPTSN